MALESATHINDLVATNPTSSDNVSDGDNHIRLIKLAVKTTFPNITGAMTKTHTELNTTVVDVAAATDANTASTIVKRDGSGNFTAGTVTAALTGDVTGNVTGNLTGNVTGNVSGTAGSLASAVAIALSGDVTGTANFDGSAGITIAATVADDSHDHVIANVDGLQAALDGKLASGANAVSASQWSSARTITLAGDLSGNVSIDGSGDVTLTAAVSDNSHLHAIGNVTGLQAALDGKLSTTGTAANSTQWGGYNISTAATGNDANTIYFRT
jgi:hypothetical protein